MTGAPKSRASGSGKRAQPPVEKAGFLGPPEEVSAAEAPGRPRRSAGGDNHVPARLAELLRDLASRLAATDDQHLSRGQCLLVAVISTSIWGSSTGSILAASGRCGR